MPKQHVTEATLAAANAFIDQTVIVPISMAAPASRWSYAPAALGIVNTTTAVTIKTAAGAGVRNVVTGIQIFAGTLGAGTEVAIRDGAAGTVLWRGLVGTGGAAYGVTFPTPLRGTANTLLEVVTLTATVTGGVYVNVQGYTQ